MDPQLVEAFKTATSSLLAPTSSVKPIPTVTPDYPTYEKIGESGSKTLWVCLFLSWVDDRCLGSGFANGWAIGRFCTHVPLDFGIHLFGL